MTEIEDLQIHIESIEFAMDEKRAELNSLSREYMALKMEKLRVEDLQDGRVAA
jgi:hypothetical protein